MPRQDTNRDLYPLLAVITAIIGVATLYFARSVLVPLALAVLFTFLLTPPVGWLERIRLGRILSALVVVTLAMAGLGAIGWTVAKQLVDVTNQLPNYRTNIEQKIEMVRTTGNGTDLNKAKNTVSVLRKELSAVPVDTGPDGKLAKTLSGSKNNHPVPVEIVTEPQDLLSSAPSLFGPIGSAGIVIVFTFFMLILRDDLRNRVIHLAGDSRIQVMTEAFDEVNLRISRYLFLQFVVNTGYAAVVGSALHFIGIPHAFLWGVIAGALRFLPYLGVPIAAIMPILLSLAISDTWAQPFMTIGMFAVVEIVVSNLIEPLLYAEHTGLSSIAILLAAMFWTVLWGPIGLLLATPMTVCLIVMSRYVPNMHFLNVLLSDDPPLTPEAGFYQRLLALDRRGALIHFVKDRKQKSALAMCDGMLIPALVLAKRDRHRNAIDAPTEQFIFQTIRELIVRNDAVGADSEKHSASNGHNLTGAAGPHGRVICLAARDEADEIAGAMLVQALRHRGWNADTVAAGTLAETRDELLRQNPSVVCISALPPFALARARQVYRELRAEAPNLKVVVGLWKFCGDEPRAAARVGMPHTERIAAELADALEEIAKTIQPAGLTVDPAAAGDAVASAARP
ncbi:MAG: AI-2E family transporter [Candidatus Acidiferrales bacterium]